MKSETKWKPAFNLTLESMHNSIKTKKSDSPKCGLSLMDLDLKKAHVFGNR